MTARPTAGCGAACLVFWNEAWLKPVEAGRPVLTGREIVGARCGTGSTEDEVWARTLADDSNANDPTYRCQATCLPDASSPLPWWDLRQYLEDYTSGNVTLAELAGGLAYVLFFTVFRVAGRLPGTEGSRQPLRPRPGAAWRGAVPASVRARSNPVSQRPPAGWTSSRARP